MRLESEDVLGAKHRILLCKFAGSCCMDCLACQDSHLGRTTAGIGGHVHTDDPSDDFKHG